MAPITYIMSHTAATQKNALKTLYVSSKESPPLPKPDKGKNTCGGTPRTEPRLTPIVFRKTYSFCGVSHTLQRVLIQP